MLPEGPSDSLNNCIVLVSSAVTLVVMVMVMSVCLFILLLSVLVTNERI